MRSFLLLPLFALATVTTSIGCAAPTGDDEASESAESEVRTAKCPSEITANVGSLSLRTFFAELREPSDYNAMKSINFELAGRGNVEFAGSLKTKKSGRCTYAGANGSSAVLYTKGGKDILRLTQSVAGHEVYVYTYPSSWTPALEYAPQSTARLVTALAADIDPMDDVDASEAPSPFWVTLGTGKSAVGAFEGITLANGADETNDQRPDTLRVSIPKGSATAKVTDESLAYCTATKNGALSDATRTVFDLALEYEVDDGWNGCTFAFTATGYSSQLTAGFSIDD